MPGVRKGARSGTIELVTPSFLPLVSSQCANPRFDWSTHEIPASTTKTEMSGSSDK